MSCRRMNQYRVQQRYFRCEECGMVVPAVKRRLRTNPGHEKHMWCPRCQKQTKHVQEE